ncbi:MAG: hypothetical protein ABIA91_01560 [Patescibacteria group bacterium]
MQLRLKETIYAKQIFLSQTTESYLGERVHQDENGYYFIYRGHRVDNGDWALNYETERPIFESDAKVRDLYEIIKPNKEQKDMNIRELVMYFTSIFLDALKDAKTLKYAINELVLNTLIWKETQNDAKGKLSSNQH